MKKFLKCILIVVLVVASVGGTAYLFYKNLKPEADYLTSLNEYTNNSSNVKFSNNLQGVVEKTQSVADNRFDLLLTTNNKLNQCLDCLSPYYIVYKNYDIDKKAINKQFSNVKSLQAQAINVMDAYLTKITAQGELSSGANPSYEAICAYFVNYANFINLINSQISKMGVDRTADLKFSAIEVYCNVCANTFNSISKQSVEIINVYAISQLNVCVKFKDSFLDLTNDFSYLNNLFVKIYDSCNKNEFALHFMLYYTQGEQDSSSKEMQAGYYFKTVFGV